MGKEPVNGEYLENAPNTISMPFPKGAPPNPVRLKEYALDPDDDPETDDATYYKAVDGDTFYRPEDPDTYLTWNDLIPNGNNDDIVFIDAQGQDLLYDGSTLSGARQGIIVSWCGNLEMRNATFTGIALSLQGGEDVGLPQGPSGEVSTTCGDDMGLLKTSNSDVASYRNSLLKAWLYANGGNSETPGVEIGRNSNIFFLPSGSFDLLDLISQISTPTQYSLRGWRECYQLEPAGECST